MDENQYIEKVKKAASNAGLTVHARDALPIGIYGPSGYAFHIGVHRGTYMTGIHGWDFDAIKRAVKEHDRFMAEMKKLDSEPPKGWTLSKYGFYDTTGPKTPMYWAKERDREDRDLMRDLFDWLDQKKSVNRKALDKDLGVLISETRPLDGPKRR